MKAIYGKEEAKTKQVVKEKDCVDLDCEGEHLSIITWQMTPLTLNKRLLSQTKVNG